jgi:ribosomal protein L37AE/L43A
MNWQNLKQNKCPVCSSNIKAESLLAEYYICTRCTFKIHSKKYDEIMTDRFKPKTVKPIKSFEKSLSDFNNDGRHEVSEDFSDSPFADRI